MISSAATHVARNLVMVANDGNLPVNLHNTLSGTTELVADLFGYFS